MPDSAAAHFPKSWGAEPLHDGRWCFSLWAPDAGKVEVELGSAATPLESEADGWWSIEAEAAAGQAYRFVVDGKAYPDPAARAQEGDVHGPSLLVDPTAYVWETEWSGLPWSEAVVYELHLGTFTQEGTFAAATRELHRLRALGITLVELLPVAQFDGNHGWGYDGVLPYAPHKAYGAPDDLRRFVDHAHALGMGVLLDVVYNHLGPSGNYLPAWCPSFFHPERSSPWGQGIAYEARPVRDYFIENALTWLTEYRLDGLRLDAVHAIEDHSPVHFLDELGERVRRENWGRPIHLVTEDERNLARYFAADAAFDATWNDDWHHAFHCLLTGEDEAYYAPFAVDPLADIAIALRDGYVEQGQDRQADADPRGEPSGDLPRTAFVNFLGNHDQVGNRARGERLHQLMQDRTALRVATAMTLLAPFVPMIFMGDEFLTDAPFLFFADFSGELAEAVRKGRAEEFAQFKAFGGEVPDPISPATFAASKIASPARDDQREHEAFLRELLAFRRAHVAPLLAENPSPHGKVERDGAFLRATWDFGATRLSLHARLGEGRFEAHEDPLVSIASPESPFAFSAALLPDQQP